MSDIGKARRVRLVPAVLGLAAIAAGAGAAGAGSYGSQPLRCEIQVDERGNSVALEGLVFAKSAIEGSYHLTVSKSGGSGSSEINQSGGFSAGPGGPASLASVTLGGGGSYIARLRVTWDGHSVECTERVRGSL